MKILGVSRAGNMWLVGDDEKNGKWYFLGSNVTEFAKGFKRGDSVEITTEEKDKKHTISFIKRAGGASSPTPTPTPSTGGNSMMYKAVCTVCGKDCEVPFKPRSTAGITCKECFNASKGISTPSASSTGHSSASSRPTDVQESIKRQAIGNMTSRTMISLQGLVNEQNVHTIVREVYKTYQELVG